MYLYMYMIYYWLIIFLRRYEYCQHLVFKKNEQIKKTFIVASV